MKNKAEYIAFTVEKDCEKIEIGKQCSVRGDSLVDKILEKEAEVVQVPAEIIEQNMEETVSRFVRTLTKIDAESPIGRLYSIMIEDCARPGEEMDELMKLFCSFISDEISRFDTDLYYQNPSYLECSYQEGYLLD